MTSIFDLIIIGSGVAGKSLASGFASKGKSVAVIEEDLWGGTCPNRGCDPKKVLHAAVEAMDKVKQLKGKGLEAEARINWSELMAFKQTFTDPVSDQSRQGLEDAGVQTFTGSAHFIDATTIEVGADRLSGRQLVIASGASPLLIDILGKEHFKTSDDFLSLPDLPESVTFVGGGYITFELAAIASTAGAKVHVIQHNDKPLKAYDSELVEELMNQLKGKGVQFHLNTALQEIRQIDQGYLLKAGADFELQTDLVFGATGRKPNTDALNLAAAGIDFDKKGVLVNAYMQTSNPSVFALGDVVSKTIPKLTPVAGFEASYLLDFLTGQTDEAITYPPVPTIVFSSPKLAQVGVTRAEAEQSPDHYSVSTVDAGSWFSYSRINEPVSKVTLVTDAQSGYLVGAACLNQEADQLINDLTLLISRQVSTAELSRHIFAYPSIASDLPSLYN
ncbi:Glutathione reductase [Alkalibacterium sp. AK22]|uniref:dihydrolipoyl dehydrogenase family protein n=1 Tax=Alkalibacterium sp. AK22 TaxID=1229520 RepID=UPI00044C542C|nr:NAD(P)/FAD-dependent oxidoreductase [Alkalibacterium sp. AK22]EXJ23367.1 Glutathione reductase [Alkalibacterium sp. AK22]